MFVLVIYFYQQHIRAYSAETTYLLFALIYNVDNSTVLSDFYICVKYSINFLSIESLIRTILACELMGQNQ